MFKSTFGGSEVIIILEFDHDEPSKVRYEYKLLSTSKTSTMQKEMQEAGDAGFMFVGVTVSKLMRKSQSGTVAVFTWKEASMVATFQSCIPKRRLL